MSPLVTVVPDITVACCCANYTNDYKAPVMSWLADLGTTVVSFVSAVYLVSARWSVGVSFSSLSSSSNVPSARTPTPPPPPPSLPRTACPTSTWPGSSSSMLLVLAWSHRSTPRSSPMSICTFLMTVVETLRGMSLAFFFLRLSLFVSVMMLFPHRTF